MPSLKMTTHLPAVHALNRPSISLMTPSGQEDFNFVSSKTKKSPFKVPKTVMTQHKIDMQKQLEPILQKNYKDSRAFFSYLTQELCYSDNRAAYSESTLLPKNDKIIPK